MENKIPEGFKKQEMGNFWKPQKEGEEIRGTIIKKFEGDYGFQYTIKKEGSDEEITTPSHKGLQNRLSEAKEGQEVLIIYGGEVPPKVRGQSPAQKYEVYLKEDSVTGN